MAHGKQKKTKEKKIWKSFTESDYKESVSNLVHFSAKTINSNTPAFGIRLGKMDRKNLPFVSVSTMDPATVPYDYEKNAGSTATILAQVAAVQENRLEDFDAVPPQDMIVIRDALKLLHDSYETTCSFVGMRLRQVIVQEADGRDITLTPLQSSGFSKLLEDRLGEEKEAIPDNPYRRRGFLGIGGANPQNVGRHVRAMNRPLWFSAPHENKAIRKAIAIHYKGVPLNIPQSLLHDFHQWRQAILDQHKGLMPSDLELRSQEESKLRAMVDCVLSKANKASAMLEKYRSTLPGEKLVSGNLPPVQQGLLDCSLRDSDWRRKFAKEFHERLLDSRIYVKGDWRFLGIGEVESTRWIRIIEGFL